MLTFYGVLKSLSIFSISLSLLVIYYRPEDLQDDDDLIDTRYGSDSKENENSFGKEMEMKIELLIREIEILKEMINNDNGNDDGQIKKEYDFENEELESTDCNGESMHNNEDSKNINEQSNIKENSKRYQKKQEKERLKKRLADREQLKRYENQLEMYQEQLKYYNHFRNLKNVSVYEDSDL